MRTIFDTAHAAECPFSIDERVAPRAPTRDPITYGYVKQLGASHPQGPAVVVYWPEIRSRGVWPVADLRSLSRREAAPAEQLQVADVSGVVELLQRAQRHLKYPKLWLAFADESPLRITIAGERSKTPGYLMLTDGGRYPDNKYFGRISPDGELEIGRDGHARRDELVALLERLAADPATVAAEYGHLTGSCCFCSLPLSDERSIAVGYGKKCAQNYDLPWGAAK